MTSRDVFDEVDAIFDRFVATGAAPGLAYGVVIGGELVHARGRGTLRTGEAAEPDADSVFRIASMTKSFTASTVLLLRDEGRLRLDDPVSRHVPELAGLAPLTRDAAPLTIEALLTMSAGLPTDDPWGDRQQDLDPAAFLRFLEGGPELAWPVGTHFEYSNLGFAILGLVIARVTGEEYRSVVERRILEPLGMTSTTFMPDGVDPSRIALGYVKRGEDWVEEPLAGHGAFAPMGGLFTSVRDLARWVGGFMDAFPARDDADDAHPLSRATRREQQQVHRPTPPELTWESAGKPPTPFVGGYGYGLFTSLDVRHGRIVGHGGGYPGFGSHMRWHPASGIGVVALANARYAGVIAPSREALIALLTAEAAPARRHVPWPATTDARADVERLLEAWDDELAVRLFAMNVALDEDLAARRAAIERLREVHGALRPDETEPVVSFSPAHLSWWLAGDRGRVQVEILMSPERPPLVQALNVTSIPDPPARLVTIAERVVALLGDASPAWPPDARLAEPVDRAALDRDLRAAAAMFGPVRLGPPTAGDGVKTSTWRLLGERGDLTLTLELDDPEALIAKVALVPVAIESPVHLA